MVERERLLAHLLGGLGRPAAPEHGQAAEEALQFGASSR
jgi:hypothetical protein